MSVQRLSFEQGKTLSLSALGGALEFYDFIIFAFFATLISQLFFPPDMPDWLRMLQTFGIFSAGYLARPLGGIIIAHYGDLLGRKRMFVVSILLMTIPTLLIGIMPTYAQIGVAAPLILLFLRILQGAAVGGEVPGAWVFVAEHVSAKRVGFACGSLTAGLTLGIFLGSLIAVVMHANYTEAELLAYAWRIPFILGGVFGLAAVWLRRYLSETPVFQEIHAKGLVLKEAPIKRVFTDHATPVAITMLFTWFISASVVVMVIMLPTIFATQNIDGLSATVLQKANLVSTVFLSLGCVLFGYLVDRVRPLMLIGFGSLLLATTSLLTFVVVPLRPDLVYYMFALCGLGVSVIGAVPGICVSAFPAHVRFSGMSIAYNLAYALFGGLTPVLVMALMNYSFLSPVWYVSCVALGTLVFSLLIMSHSDNLNQLKAEERLRLQTQQA